MKRLIGLITFLLWATVCFAQAPSKVTITGFVYDNNGNPLIGSVVNEYPLNPTMVGNTAVGVNPCSTSTGTNGAFSLTCVGGTFALISIPDITAVIKTTLPSSGTVTLATLLATQQNLVNVSFPPFGNIPMGGFSFTNMSGAFAVGMPVVKGLGLSSATIFNASGTYAVPTNANHIHARVIAGGAGGGGGATGATNGGGGGGQGQVVDCDLLPINGAVTVTVGSGGLGGAAATTGSDGADSSVSQTAGAELCIAGRGKAGTGGSGGGPGTGGAAGSASTAAGGANYVGAVFSLLNPTGFAGANGTAGAGGAGAGVGQLGGNGGPPSSGVGSNGLNGMVLIWSD